MKKTILIFISLIALSINAYNQSVWTLGTGLIYSNPSATTNIGIGTATPSDKLSVTDTRITTGCTAILGLSTGANVATGYAGYFSKTGASATNVGGYFSASGATNNYGIIVANGIVGIGTTAPSSTSLLSVGSTSQFQVNSTGGITSSGNIIFSSFTSNGGPLFTNGSGTLSQVTAGTATTVLHGGTTPSFGAVSLANDITGTLSVSNGGTGATNLTGILKGNGTSAVSALTGTQNNLTKWTSTSGIGNSLVYDNGTNVGIGTTSPTNLLDIEQSSNAEASVLRLGNTYGSGSYQTSVSINFFHFGSTFPAAKIVEQEYDNADQRGSLQFYTKTTDYDIAPTEKMRILSNGNVGIGTIVPSNNLSVTPFQYSTGTASQSTTTITGTGTSWTSAMVGSQLVFANGVSAGTIIAYGSATSLTVTTSQTVTSQAYVISYTGFQVTSSGKVGIGTTSPIAKLEIKAFNIDPAIIVRSNDTIHFRVRANGYVEARDVLVKTGEIFPDYVFEKDYKLLSLAEVEKFINDNKHLPDVPSAADVKNGGLNVAAMDAAILKKVEEQTLYIIDLQKQIVDMQKEIVLLKSK